MTQVGHTLTGLAIGVACLPGKRSARARLIHLVAFGFLANIPDLPLKNWGHDLYYFSHSLFVNLLLILIALSAFIFFEKYEGKSRRMGCHFRRHARLAQPFAFGYILQPWEGFIDVLAAFGTAPGAAHPLVFGGQGHVAAADARNHSHPPDRACILRLGAVGGTLDEKSRPVQVDQTAMTACREAACTLPPAAPRRGGCHGFPKVRKPCICIN